MKSQITEHKPSCHRVSEASQLRELPTNNHHSGYTLGKLSVFTDWYQGIICSFSGRYSNCFMVLLNQRMHSEEPSRDSSATPESGTMRASSIDRGLRSGSFRAAGEISIIQFSEITTGDPKASSDDIELGRVSEGMKV